MKEMQLIIILVFLLFITEKITIWYLYFENIKLEKEIRLFQQK